MQVMGRFPRPKMASYFICSYMWDFPKDNARNYPEDNPASDFQRVDQGVTLGGGVFMCVTSPTSTPELPRTTTIRRVIFTASITGTRGHPWCFFEVTLSTMRRSLKEACA